MKSLAVVAASPIAEVPAESACPACSTIPVATRFTRATGDCLRDERLVEERLLPLLLPLLLALLLVRLAPPLLLRDELFDVLFLDALFEPPRELLFDAPPFDALLRDGLLRDELLLPLRLVLLLLLLLPLFRPLLLLPRELPLLRPLDVRDADLRDADLREPEALDEEREEEPPVRDPALRLELLRDDFFVAMLDSETRWVDQLRDSKQESRTNVGAARVMFAPALSSGASRIVRHSVPSLGTHGESMQMGTERMAECAVRRTMRRSMSRTLAAGCVAALVIAAACGRGDTSRASAPPVAGKISAGAAGAADTDVVAHGAALPTGYVAQLDRANASPGDIAYSQREPGRWEVRTGPAHILYQPSDTAKGTYTVSATFEQLEAPAHPEAFGVFIGGSGLTDPATRKYTYFIVRGDGKYSVKSRNGADVRTIADWTASSAIPKQDSAGKALYGIKVESDGKTARVSVNGAPVTTITAKDGPISGIAGVRVNHNLHLVVTPVSVIR